ncbi:MAG: DUF4160 domain-containing protein [Caulobacteraceae bacterium]
MEALFDIQTLELIRGRLPRRAPTTVLEWAQEHCEALLGDWTPCTTRSGRAASGCCRASADRWILARVSA